MKSRLPSRNSRTGIMPRKFTRTVDGVRRTESRKAKADSLGTHSASASEALKKAAHLGGLANFAPFFQLHSAGFGPVRQCGLSRERPLGFVERAVDVALLNEMPSIAQAISIPMPKTKALPVRAENIVASIVAVVCSKSIREGVASSDGLDEIQRP